MKRIACQISLGLTALALLGMTLPAVAAPVALKATMVGPNPSVEVLPIDPPIGLGIYRSTGQATLLGDFKYVEPFNVRLGIDGNPLSWTTAPGSVFTAANGDALFMTHSGVWLPTGAVAGVWLITGGRGRFVGATGSGRIRSELDAAKNELHCTFEGMINAPAFQ